MIFRTGHARPATSGKGASTPISSIQTPATTLPGPCCSTPSLAAPAQRLGAKFGPLFQLGHIVGPCFRVRLQPAVARQDLPLQPGLLMLFDQLIDGVAHRRSTEVTGRDLGKAVPNALGQPHRGHVLYGRHSHIVNDTQRRIQEVCRSVYIQPATSSSRSWTLPHRERAKSTVRKWLAMIALVIRPGWVSGGRAGLGSHRPGKACCAH
jgi:hypothetical protein